MDRIDIRELRDHTTAIVRRVAAGETFEITDRSEVVALLVGKSSRGLSALIDQGLVRLAEGNLLDIEPLRIPSGSVPASSLVIEGRGP